MKLDSITNQVYIVASNEAKLKSHEFVTPEHFLYASVMFDIGRTIVTESGGDVAKISLELNGFFDEYLEKNDAGSPTDSVMLIRMFETAANQAMNSQRTEIGLGDLLAALLSLNESFAQFVMLKNGVDRLSLLRYISHELKSAKDAEAKRKSGNMLKSYTVNLTDKAVDGELDRLVGREDLLKRTTQVLMRRQKNNPVHVGDPGVGKTAIVEGLAQLIAEGKVPGALKGANVYYIDLGAVIAGTKFRGDFEDRLIKILDEASAEKNAIVYLDEIHNIVGAGSVSGGAMDATSIIKPYLVKNTLRFIGSTTHEEYKKHFEKDSALTRRFQRIDVDEPSLDDTVTILKGIKSRYELFHGITLSDEVLKLACELSVKYLNDRRLPDKAIDVIDETGAHLRMNAQSDEGIEVKQLDIEKTVALMSKTPETTVSESEAERIIKLGDSLRAEIFGQDKAIDSLVSAVKASRFGLNDPDKPIASLLFVGPTGVGKTELARQLAVCLDFKLVRYDMSEYQEAHTVARLIGSPPGYVGYDEGGLLTEAIRKTPSCVLLLDEIEKAHPDILNVLLQIMDYGCLTDNIGKKADFRNVILIMTSNAGAKELGRRVIGFDDKRVSVEAIEREVERKFPPEFRNRLDDIVTFNGVDIEMARRIAKKAISRLSGRLETKGSYLEASGALIEWLAQKGLNTIYGAREIIRVVDRDVRKLIVDNFLFSDKLYGKTIQVDIIDDKIVLMLGEQAN